MTTRAVLCVSLSVLTFGVGIATALVQSHNHERGLALNSLKEHCSMLEAINGDCAADIFALDFGPIAPEVALTPRETAGAGSAVKP